MLRTIIAFLASVLTVIQAIFLYTQGKGICFNDGCEIVDNLTTISPLFFNVVGFLFFQILFWCLLWGRKGSVYWHKFAGLLLLTSLGVEAVLVFFQYSIAGVFCTYCLIILAIILLLNLLYGIRQIFCGSVLFLAVIATCFSLQFETTSGSGISLDKGTMATVIGEQEDTKLFLLFSPTCEHCIRVLDALKEENYCTVSFNPVEHVDIFTFPDAKYFAEYDPAINLNFLQSLSINEIPVLVAVEQDSTLVIKGGRQILEYLDKSCQIGQIEIFGVTTDTPPLKYDFLQFIQNQEDNSCSTTIDCNDEKPQEGVKQE